MCHLLLLILCVTLLRYAKREREERGREGERGREERGLGQKHRRLQNFETTRAKMKGVA